MRAATKGGCDNEKMKGVDPARESIGCDVVLLAPPCRTTRARPTYAENADGVSSSVSRERKSKDAADVEDNVGDRSVKYKEARDVTADATVEPRGVLG